MYIEIIGLASLYVAGVMERQLASQLPGGVFWEPSEALRAQAQSCSSTNISGERTFGMVDYELQRARHATVGHVEGKVMYKKNETGQWLAVQQQSDKEQRLTLARKEATSIAKEEKEQKVQVATRILQKLQDARKERQAKEDNNREKNEKLLQAMYANGGLWDNESDMEKNMGGKMSKTKSVAMLKCQINVRVKLLKCVAPERVLLGKATVPELQAHLRSLWQLPVPAETLDVYNFLCAPEALLGVDFTQNWKDASGIDNWEEGQVAVQFEDTGEFRLDFQEGNFCFMEKEEMLVDLLNKDLVLF